jgi:histidine triad (HIT) family protein
MPGEPEPSGGPCIFCEIVAGRAPAERVGERPEALAFLTIGPLREGHALVVPKRHVVELVDASPGEWADVTDLGQEVARNQRARLGSEGETLFVASGVAGEQAVGHLHLHVVPRQRGDGLDLTSWWGRRVQSPERPALAGVARRLRGEP